MEQLSVANIIALQLAGIKNPLGRLAAMIGGHTFTQSEDAFTFKFKARSKIGANCCRITLTAMDDYQVEFFSIRGTSIKSKAFAEGIYAENLRQVFESKTGLYLSL